MAWIENEKNEITSAKEDKKFVHLMIILVLEKYRRYHIASQIFEELENLIKNSEIPLDRIQLHVLKDNTPAIEFYMKKGFAIKEEIKDYYTLDNGDSGTALIMVKPIVGKENNLK